MAAGLQFFYAMVPSETDRKIAEVYKPFGIVVSILFIIFGFYVWLRGISSRAAILLFIALCIVDIGGTMLIGAIIGPGA